VFRNRLTSSIQVRYFHIPYSRVTTIVKLGGKTADFSLSLGAEGRGIPGGGGGCGGRDRSEHATRTTDKMRSRTRIIDSALIGHQTRGVGCHGEAGAAPWPGCAGGLRVGVTGASPTARPASRFARRCADERAKASDNERVEFEMLATLIVVAALSQSARQTAPDAGSLAGCILDASGQRLPGVTILAQLSGVRRTTEADTNGCYEMKDLGPGSYRVIARLRGFTPVTRNRVIVTRLEWVMRVSGICECVKIGGSLSERVTYAGAVFHVRIVEPDLTQPQPDGFYRQSAQVLNVLKRSDSVRSATISFLQNLSGLTDPYDVGEELVVFFESSNGPFTIVNDNPGLNIGDADHMSMVFRVRDGKIQDAPSDLRNYVGMRLDAFLEELRGHPQK
jgi:hypothetical protein